MKHDDQLEMILSVLRHELGNSVSAVKITLDVLQENFDQFDDHKKRVYLERGSALLERQNTLVRALKSYSKFNVGATDQVAILPLWERFAQEARTLSAQREVGVLVETRLESQEILGDSLALRKALHFILENALESVTQESPGTIQLTAEEEEGALVITIGDNGSGMNADQLAKAPIPLYTTKPDRMGMGLPIARKLLGEMGGRLDIESLPGEGTRVRIWLPTISYAAAVG